MDLPCIRNKNRFCKTLCWPYNSERSFTLMLNIDIGLERVYIDNSSKGTTKASRPSFISKSVVSRFTSNQETVLDGFESKQAKLFAKMVPVNRLRH